MRGRGSLLLQPQGPRFGFSVPPAYSLEAGLSLMLGGPGCDSS